MRIPVRYAATAVLAVVAGLYVLGSLPHGRTTLEDATHRDNSVSGETSDQAELAPAPADGADQREHQGEHGPLAGVEVAAQTPAPHRPQVPAACITDWSEAGPIVRREGLVPMDRIGRLARERAHVEILNSALCKVEGGYVYRLRVFGGHDVPQGAFRTIYVDARKPFAR